VDSVEFEVDGSVIRVVGEIDVRTTPQLFAEVMARTADGSSCIDLDLSEVTFMDSSGLNTLIKLRRRRPNIWVVKPSVRVRRILDIAGLTQMLVLPANAS
jgi:anti-sigma B factor antagonist